MVRAGRKWGQKGLQTRAVGSLLEDNTVGHLNGGRALMRWMCKRGKWQRCFDHDGLRIPGREGLQGEVIASIRTIGVIEGKK